MTGPVAGPGSGEQRILRLLQRRGSKGVFVWDFTIPTADGGKPYLRVAARIRDLRKKGYLIRSHRLMNGSSRYELLGEPVLPATPGQGEALAGADTVPPSGVGRADGAGTAQLFAMPVRPPNAATTDWDDAA